MYWWCFRDSSAWEWQTFSYEVYLPACVCQNGYQGSFINRLNGCHTGSGEFVVTVVTGQSIVIQECGSFSFYSHSLPSGPPSTKAAGKTLQDCPDLHHCHWLFLKTQFHFSMYRDLVFILSISLPHFFSFLSLNHLLHHLSNQRLHKSIQLSRQQNLNDTRQ